VVLPRKEGWFNRSMRLFEKGAHYPDIFRYRKAPVIYADTLARDVRADDASAVLYVACVLEYVTELRRSMDEILRIAGGPENIYIVTVQPWTLTAACIRRPPTQPARPHNSGADDNFRLTGSNCC
jgi:hypothetical protein